MSDLKFSVELWVSCFNWISSVGCLKISYFKLLNILHKNASFKITSPSFCGLIFNYSFPILVSYVIQTFLSWHVTLQLGRYQNSIWQIRGRQGHPLCFDQLPRATGNCRKWISQKNGEIGHKNSFSRKRVFFHFLIPFVSRVSNPTNLDSLSKFHGNFLLFVLLSTKVWF
jgi:hypothetical protein